MFEDYITDEQMVDFLNQNANMNLRIVNGVPIYNGGVIRIGDIKESKEYYLGVCSFYYYKSKLNHIN